MSPDLNPIEWLWADMKRFVRKRLCKNEDELIQAILDFRKTITPEMCTNYILKLKEVIVEIKKLNKYTFGLYVAIFV
jgi:transposase